MMNQRHAAFLIMLSIYLSRRPESAAGEGSKRRIVIPWFALGFVAVAALGVTTHISAIRTAGIRPLGLAALLFGWLIFGGLAINTGVSAVLG